MQKTLAAYGVSVSLSRKGEGWYFEDGGDNWRFRGHVIAYYAKGCVAVVMTNAAGGRPLAQEIIDRIARAYGWDTLDKPVLR
jgi:hypothetical protein